jgi:leucyl aminopeptidase
MKFFLDTPGKDSIPVRPARAEGWASQIETLQPRARAWIRSTRYEVEPGKLCLVPGEDGALSEVILGVGAKPSPWDWSGLPGDLPALAYHVSTEISAADANAAALGWALGAYRFDRFRKAKSTERARLAWPTSCERERVAATVRATYLVRDLINAPASDMGPAQLAQAASELSERHHASLRQIIGDDLLKQGYPAIHAVGRAAAEDRLPRLIDLRWGDPAHPKVTLVGKGVCFDSGGLDLKPAAHMKLMKKDMGGGAHVLGMASMVMDNELPVRLRVLVPAVENSVSGSALRPLDVVTTRAGITVEIGNTDAEGRVILSDALADASGETPDVLLDFATLTGAARVALGPELPALFCNDDTMASGLLEASTRESDPLWRMPLWQPYRSMIDSKVADITNAPDAPLGGAITAALFLQQFVGSGIPWAHIDVMAWNQSAKPGRPEGGEAMGMRAVYAYLEARF